MTRLAFAVGALFGGTVVAVLMARRGVGVGPTNPWYASMRHPEFVRRLDEGLADIAAGRVVEWTDAGDWATDARTAELATGGGR